MRALFHLRQSLAERVVVLEFSYLLPASPLLLNFSFGRGPPTHVERSSRLAPML